jgi:hypothetical protein
VQAAKAILQADTDTISFLLGGITVGTAVVGTLGGGERLMLCARGSTVSSRSRSIKRHRGMSHHWCQVPSIGACTHASQQKAAILLMGRGVHRVCHVSMHGFGLTRLRVGLCSACRLAAGQDGQ